jgi:ubiquinone/menaquinone biosynthesis C-methylase UbiE
LDEARLSPEEAKTQDVYRVYAPVYATSHSDPDWWRSALEKFQELLPSGRILDIGCGTGRDALLISTAGYAYTGIDLCRQMLEQARRNAPEAAFANMSMYVLGFRPNSFDGLWASASLLHSPKRRVRAALREIRRVVKPGGVCFFSLKEGEGEGMIPHPSCEGERFFAFYREEEFISLLGSEGFEVLEFWRDLRQYNPPEQKTVWLLYLARIT